MNETLTFPDLLDDPDLQEADSQAVQHFAETGEPLDPAFIARVHARSDRVREANFLRVGYVDWEQFRRPSVDDE